MFSASVRRRRRAVPATARRSSGPTTGRITRAMRATGTPQVVRNVRSVRENQMIECDTRRITRSMSRQMEHDQMRGQQLN